MFLAIDAGPTQAPWGFLLIFVLPFAAGPLLLRRHRRTATAITGLFSAALATTCAVVIVGGNIEHYVMDYVVVFVGGPAAAVLTVLSARLFHRPTLDVRHVQGGSPSVR